MSAIAADRRFDERLICIWAVSIGCISLAIGAGAYIDQARETSIAVVSGQVLEVINGAQRAFGKHGYAGLTTAIAVGARVIPQSTHASSTTANNKYSGAITLVDNSGTTPGTALLTYANVPADECTGIVNGTQTLARQMTVGGTEVKSLDGTINLATLNAQCTSAANVPISWTIART